MCTVSSSPLKRTISLLMFKEVPDVDNVLVVRLWLDIAPVVEIVPVAVKSKTIDMF